eukprot:scaffold59442_cov66-Attheya_sp.AAC.1
MDLIRVIRVIVMVMDGEHTRLASRAYLAYKHKIDMKFFLSHNLVDHETYSHFCRHLVDCAVEPNLGAKCRRRHPDRFR